MGDSAGTARSRTTGVRPPGFRAAAAPALASGAVPLSACTAGTDRAAARCADRDGPPAPPAGRPR